MDLRPMPCTKNRYKNMNFFRLLQNLSVESVDIHLLPFSFIYYTFVRLFIFIIIFFCYLEGKKLFPAFQAN